MGSSAAQYRRSITPGFVALTSADSGAYRATVRQTHNMIVAATSDPTAFRRAALQFRKVDGGDRFLRAEGSLGFVAIVADDIAGWCWGQHIVRPDDTSTVYLHEVEVAERFRRRGLGRALVEAFMDGGRRLGASRMFLTTGEANGPARALFEGLGAGLAEQGPTMNYWAKLAP